MRLLLSTDGFPHGQAAIRYGAILARCSPETSTVLGVLETPGFWQAQDRWEEFRIQRALEEARGLLVGEPEPRFNTRRGPAAEEILEEGASGDYYLLVVGARGRRRRALLLAAAMVVAVAWRSAVSSLSGRRTKTPTPCKRPAPRRCLSGTPQTRPKPRRWTSGRPPRPRGWARATSKPCP
jgi:hypothetical protein